jgi:WhiB family redox-sensing transcriptional regulator
MTSHETAPDWRDDAACLTADPEAFFPARDAGGVAVLAAVEVCLNCDVAEQCLAYALAAGIGHGIFGGLTPLERRRLADQP